MFRNLHFLVLFNLLHQQFMAIIPCEDLTFDGWVLFDNDSFTCADDSSFKIWGPPYNFITNQLKISIGQKNYESINMASSVDLFPEACNIKCNGCYPGTQDNCLSCASYSRTWIYPTIIDIQAKKVQSCDCISSLVESVPPQQSCRCPTQNYFYYIYNKDTNQIKCYDCPINLGSCSFQSENPLVLISSGCAYGIGRSTNTQQLCPCTPGYIEFNPMQKDCKLDCKPPCASCVGDSITKCATCQDTKMTINEDISCVCPSDYYMGSSSDNLIKYCVKCDYTCNTCAVSSNNCITCSITNNRILKSGTCPCNDFYFEIPLQPECIPCQWSCQSCSQIDKCSSCPPGSNRDINFTLNNDYFCHCLAGYAEDLNSNACLPCQDTCLTCIQTIDTCESCDDTKNRELFNNRCQCLPHYFEVKGETICQECAPTCLSCDGVLETNCLSCLSSYNRILNHQKECQCKSGYGYDYQMSEQCIQCLGICQNCDYFDNCIQCPDGSNRILDSNKQCICDDGFYEDMNYYLCKPCHSSCSTCDTQSSCLTCDINQGRIINEINKSCDCQPGYYEFYKQCFACYYTCQKCVSQYKDGCTSCPDSRMLSDTTKTNSQCLCKSVSQIDDGKSLECTNCHYSCKTCQGSEFNSCLTCYDNSDDLLASRTIKYGICRCPNNWYDDQINEKCSKCHNSCDTCFYSDEYSCITCSEINHRVQQSNSCYCQDGYFEDLQTLNCKPCEYRCGTCVLNETNCLTCPLGSLRELVQQINNSAYMTCQCPATAPNDVQNNPICQTCHFTCQNCNDKEVNQCTLCDPTANRVIFTDDNGTYCNCALQYYEIQTPECAQCSSYCLGCFNTATNCISCNPQQFRELNGNQCKCASRFGTQKLSYYDNMLDPECIACHYSCYTCNGPQYNQCLTCSDLDFRTQQGSSCACQPKYIDNGEGQCMSCDQSCETCEGQKNLCTSCPAGSLRTLNVQSQSCDCPFGFFDSGAQICELCDIKCASCTNQSTTCLSCVAGSNRLLNQLFYSCDCLSGYYDSGTGVCSICHYTCLQCSGPSFTECVSCPDFLATKRSLIGQTCICPDKYYDDQNNQQCQPCSSTCHNCQLSQNSCTQCVIGQNRSLQGQQCVCQSSYYESGSPACSKCSNLCQECQITSTTCTQCDSSLNRFLDQAKCNCIPGYFDDGTLICKKCHYSCQTCISDSSCSSCDSQSFRQLISNQCVCIDGTTDQGVAMCFSCDTRCLTCTNITTQCLSCDALQLRTLSGYNCNCKDGYFENNIKQCVICEQNCVTCINSGTTCTSCDLTQNKILDSSQKCLCKNGYYADSNDTCQQCSNKCQTCSQTSSNCTSCQTDRILQLNLCNCLSGFYDSTSGCQRCSYQCETCETTAIQCLSCDPISKRTLKSSQCVCNQGYYDIGSFICAQCAQTCLTCQTQNTLCQSCDSSLNRILNGSSCNCLPGYYSLNQDKQCSKCHISCNTCVDQATKCTSCDITTTFRMDQSILFNKCPCSPGFYDDGTITCKICSYKCINCVGSQDNCTICLANPGYYRNNLQPTCDCQAGYFDDGVQVICQKCDKKCETCQSSSANCLVCEQQQKRLTAPQCGCKPGYFEDKQQKCQICSANCQTCEIKQNNCLVCQPERITKDCLCQDGYYEANLSLCQACSYKCSTCVQDPLNCLTCASDRVDAPNCLCKYHYYDDLVNPLCQECDQYCGKCDLNGCIDCSGNRIQSGKSCICPLDSISYTDTPYCSNCNVAVIKGLFSDDISSLIYTFEYDLQFNFPVQVDKQAYCSYIILDLSIKLLGEAPQCEVQQKQLIIRLGRGSSVIVGDVIQFNSTILKHTHCSTPLELIIKTELQSPLQLLKPSIQINYPQVPISPCAPIDVRIEKQFINGQRNLQLSWSSSLLIPSIYQANQFQFQTLTIEQGQVSQNSEIDITITFTNFLGQSDTMTIKFQTLSADVPQFSFKTIKKSYVSWVPIKILVYYANTICTGGLSTIQKNPVQITFEEIIQNRYPSQSKAITFQQQLFESQDSEGMISAIIPSRALSVNSNYSILSTFVDLVKNSKVTAQLDITIERSPLLVEIIGGSRIQNYLKSFKIEIQSKDPDIQTQWNQDSGITLLVECIDLQHNNKPCADQNNKTVPLNKTSNIQYIAPRLFQPFTVLLFKVYCSKQNQNTVTASASIIMLDSEIPPINVAYPAGYNIREVNINEKLKFQIQIDQNQMIKDMDFSYALVYNYETVFVKSIPNQNLTFAIWEGFQKFNYINQISIKIQAHNMRYLMPQIATITLFVNMPPVNSVINITPQDGNALYTQFNFRVTNSSDTDAPIQYRFAYYYSQSLYLDDIYSGDQDNLVILQDFSTLQTYKSILESGNLTILISVSDSLGSTVNYTQQIRSYSFYEQWQLSKEQNDTANPSNCKKMVQELQITLTDQQQMIVYTLELIKLLKQQIQKDCIKLINLKLMKIKDQLFEMMLKQVNPISQSRISNVLAQIYQLNLEKQSRLLQSDNQICFNTSNNKIQFKQLTQILQNVTDNDLVQNISQISSEIQKAIANNKNLTQDYALMEDLGDEYTERSLIQNKELRKSFLRILGGLYNNVYEQKLTISHLVDQLMDSFQQNLILDDSEIKIQTNGFGLQISKISQKTFDKYIIKEAYDPDQLDLSNFTINRYIQLVKYKSNKYFYSNKFMSIFTNNTWNISRKETNKNIYEKSILPFFESYMFDIQIYVDNQQSVNFVKKIYQGKLAFNMGTKLNSCNDTTTYDAQNQYNMICSSYIQEKWVEESCQIEQYQDKNNQINFQCFCKHIAPLTLMIMNVSNSTKKQLNQSLTQINIEEFISINIIENYTVIMIISCLAIILAITLIVKQRKQQINITEIKQRFVSENQEVVELTKIPKMSMQLFKQNLLHLHEISRLIYINYMYLGFSARFLLAALSINIMITSIHILDVVIKNIFLSLAISLLISMIFQICIKVLEGFFNGPNALKIIGYIITISLNLGIFCLNIFINNSQYNPIIQLIQSIIGIVILYGPVEIIIQYVKLTQAFYIYHILKSDPFNPITNLIYYFVQDEIIICLIQGEVIE